MGVCADCQYGKNNVCPTYNPYQTKCPQNLEEVESGLKTDKELRDIQICMEYLDGHSTAALATKYDVHQSTIRKALRDNGIKPDGSRHRISTEQESKIVEDIKSNHSDTSLCKKYGVTKYQIQKIKKKYNLLKDQPENLIPKPKEDATMTFYIHTKEEKPDPKCYPAESEGKLVWAIDISTLDEFMDLQGKMDTSMLMLNGKDLYFEVKFMEERAND